MKNIKLLFRYIILGLILCNLTLAQVDPEINVGVTTNKNSITTIKLNKPVKDVSLISLSNRYQNSVVVEYSDKLGRPDHSISLGTSPGNKDLIGFSLYDEWGLETKSYLPFTISNGAGFIDLPENAQLTFYQGVYSTDASSAFSETVFEKSPLMRVTEQSAPGDNWKIGSGHTIETEMSTNNSTDAVKIFTVNSSGDPVQGANYVVGTLEKTTITDEEGKESIVFKDKEGHEILKKSILDTTPVETYYVYDDKGNLRVVIPPAAVAGGSSTYSKYITKYIYDNENRMIEKHMPEEDVVTTVYDKLGRVVLRQDGIMRLNNDWLFTKYDARGNLVLTGIASFNTTLSRSDMQTLVNSFSGPLYEKFTGETGFQGYSNNAFPKKDGNGCTDLEIWTVNYYDNYGFELSSEMQNFEVPAGFVTSETDYPNYTLSAFAKSGRTRGLATGSKVLVMKEEQAQYNDGDILNGIINSPGSPVYIKASVTLQPGFEVPSGNQVFIGPNIDVPLEYGGVQYLTSVSFYDKYGRVIQSKSENHLGGVDVASTQYDFTGKVMKTLVKHTDGETEVYTKNSFTYDQAGRLLTTYESIGAANAVEHLLSTNVYNELGQLEQKILYNSDDSPVQTLDYVYNIRGWLKSVNNIDNMGTDKFAFSLFYNENELGNQPLHNGNISAMAWNFEGSVPEAYKYTYDDLSRLKTADYLTKSTSWSSPGYNYAVNGLTYDLNGNITALKRYDPTGAIIDDLSYTYNEINVLGKTAGNQLKAVNDTEVWNKEGLAGNDFNDLAEELDEYDYDQNGNMVRDKNKQITVEYNYLNLPVKVTFDTGEIINWIYSATGAKLRKTFFDGSNGTTVTDYAGGYVYTTPALEERTLDFIAHSEGRVVHNNGGFTYEYHFKDHLGNTRVAYNEAALETVVQKMFYYPFGLTYSLTESGTDVKYKYNGKEHANENGLNWYHYGVRFYDPELGLWHTMDPADQFQTPYVYVGNMPTMLIDPDGAQASGLESMYNARAVNKISDGAPRTAYINAISRGEIVGGLGTGALIGTGIGGIVAYPYLYGAGVVLGEVISATSMSIGMTTAGLIGTGSYHTGRFLSSNWGRIQSFSLEAISKVGEFAGRLNFYASEYQYLSNSRAFKPAFDLTEGLIQGISNGIINNPEYIPATGEQTVNSWFGSFIGQSLVNGIRTVFGL